MQSADSETEVVSNAPAKQLLLTPTHSYAAKKKAPPRPQRRSTPPLAMSAQAQAQRQALEGARTDLRLLQALSSELDQRLRACKPPQQRTQQQQRLVWLDGGLDTLVMRRRTLLLRAEASVNALAALCAPAEGIPPSSSSALAPLPLQPSALALDPEPEEEPVRRGGGSSGGGGVLDRAQLVAMAEQIGLDEELFDAMLEAVDGDMAACAEMLAAQGASVTRRPAEA